MSRPNFRRQQKETKLGHSTLSIRDAQEDDLDALGALKLRSSLAWGDHVEALRELPEASQFPIDHLPRVIVAEAGGVLVGFATVVPSIDHGAELEDLFVAPEAWRTGIGKRLVAEAESKAKALGVRSLRVVAGERAQSFYEALGFQFVGSIATKFSLAAELRKRLI